MSTRCQHDCQHTVNTTVNTLSTRLSRRLSARCQHDCQDTVSTLSTRLSRRLSARCQHDCQHTVNTLSARCQDDCQHAVNTTVVNRRQGQCVAPLHPVSVRSRDTVSSDPQYSLVSGKRTLSLQWPLVLGECWAHGGQGLGRGPYSCSNHIIMLGECWAHGGQRLGRGPYPCSGHVLGECWAHGGQRLGRGPYPCSGHVLGECWAHGGQGLGRGPYPCSGHMLGECWAHGGQGLGRGGPSPCSNHVCWASVERTEVKDWEEDPITAVATCVGRVLSARRSGTGKRTLSLLWPRVLGECWADGGQGLGRGPYPFSGHLCWASVEHTEVRDWAVALTLRAPTSQSGTEL